MEQDCDLKQGDDSVDTALIVPPASMVLPRTLAEIYLGMLESGDYMLESCDFAKDKEEMSASIALAHTWGRIGAHAKVLDALTLSVSSSYWYSRRGLFAAIRNCPLLASLDPDVRTTTVAKDAAGVITVQELGRSASILFALINTHLKNRPTEFFTSTHYHMRDVAVLFMYEVSVRMGGDACIPNHRIISVGPDKGMIPSSVTFVQHVGFDTGTHVFVPD